MENQQTLDSSGAGATSSRATNRVVLELDKKEMGSVGQNLPSPILQLDGEVEEDVLKFSFESTYHQDDINELLSEIFIEYEVICALESRVKVAPLSGREIYVISLRPVSATWKNPDMDKDQADVFENVKRLSDYPALHITGGFSSHTTFYLYP